MPHADTTVSLRLSTQGDEHLPTFDFTKLSGINTCPRWGILRYSHHKNITTPGARAMALEAGTVLHQCFSAIRLWQLGFVQGHMSLMYYHGCRLFGDDRWKQMHQATEQRTDALEQVYAMALECLSTSGFVDDDMDKRRTYSNLETSLLYYAQRWDHARYPVWVRAIGKDDSDVGIEIPFSITVSTDNNDLFRYTGRIDGIHTDSRGALMVQENKTASRLNAGWRMAFNTSHQVTGYCVAASLYSDTPVSRALVLGLSIPLPRTLSEGLAIEPVTRGQRMHQQWIDWLLHTVSLHNRYVDDPLAAPMYTHSCNRYFSPCSMIPLCSAELDEQQHILTEMQHDEWSPLNEAH